MAQRGQSIRSMLWIKIDANCDRDHGAMIAIEALPQGPVKHVHPAPFPESRAKPVCPGARNRSMRSWVTRMTGPSGGAFQRQQSERRSRPAGASTTPLSRKRNPKSCLIGLAWKGDDHDREALLPPSRSRGRTDPGVDEQDYPRWVGARRIAMVTPSALVNQVRTIRAGRRGSHAEPEQPVLRSACLAQQEARGRSGLR
jgi:hypothetical protein